MKKQKKYLIIQTASIGDVILATPLVEAIKAHDPTSRIDFLLREGVQHLLKGHPKIHTVIAWDKSERKYRNLLLVLEHMRKEKYDVVINLQRFFSTGLLTAFSKASFTTGFRKNPWSFAFSQRKRHEMKAGLHEVDRNLSLLDFLPGNEVPRRPVLYPSQEALARVSQYKTSSYITVSPASIWFTKQFPKEKWIAFLDRVPDEIYVMLLGGLDDKSLGEAIRESTRHPHVLNLSGRLSLLESAALMKDARMNYANDSAAQHLASAVNAPVTTVFCSTVPEFGFGPLSDDSVVVEREDPLKCRPCGLHGHQQCPKGHFKCAMDISVEPLIRRLKI